MPSTPTKAAPLLVLRARNAAELMWPRPVSLRGEATVADALGLFTTKGISAAPVIDEAGRPVGVLSHSDLMVHQHARGDLAAGTGDPARVQDLMTPTVFAVAPEAPAAEVITTLLDLRVHRLFVVDAQGVLIGVISAIDVLRQVGPLMPA